MNCEVCGKRIPDDADFCGGCGMPIKRIKRNLHMEEGILFKTCVECGARMGIESIYCELCGTKLPENKR